MTASETLAFCFSHDPAAQPRELRMPVKSADVFLNQVDPRRRNVQRGVVGKSQREIFLVLAVLGHRVHARELGDAVGDVNDVIALLEIEERIHRPRGDHLAHAPPLLVAVEQFVMPEQRHRLASIPEIPDESAMQIPRRDVDLRRSGRGFPRRPVR